VFHVKPFADWVRVVVRDGFHMKHVTAWLVVGWMASYSKDGEVFHVKHSWRVLYHNEIS
jgi:hypothetical protein